MSHVDAQEVCFFDLCPKYYLCKYSGYNSKVGIGGYCRRIDYISECLAFKMFQQVEKPFISETGEGE